MPDKLYLLIFVTCHGVVGLRRVAAAIDRQKWYNEEMEYWTENDNLKQSIGLDPRCQIVDVQSIDYYKTMNGIIVEEIDKSILKARQKGEVKAIYLGHDQFDALYSEMVDIHMVSDPKVKLKRMQYSGVPVIVVDCSDFISFEYENIEKFKING